MRPQELINLCLNGIEIEFRYYPDQDSWYSGWIHSVQLNEYGAVVIVIRESGSPNWKTPDLIFTRTQIEKQLRLCK